MSVDDHLKEDARRAPAVDVDALFAQLDLDEAEPLRAAPTGRRRAATLGIAVLVAALSVAWQGLRPLDAVVLLDVAALAVPAALGLAYALRPMHRPAPQAPLLPVVGLAALTVAFVTGGVLVGLPVTPAPAWVSHVDCWLYSFAVAALAALGAAAAERGRLDARWRLLAIAVASGLAGFAAQTLVCPVVDPVHLAIGHGSAAFPVVLVLVALRALRG